MEVEVELTTNHWGWFEFKLCPVNAKTTLATKKCMDKHPLYLVNNPKETKFYIPPDSKKKDIFRYKVQLPSDVVCSQCVVQWTYRAGKYDFPSAVDSDSLEPLSVLHSELKFEW